MLASVGGVNASGVNASSPKNILEEIWVQNVILQLRKYYYKSQDTNL